MAGSNKRPQGGDRRKPAAGRKPAATTEQHTLSLPDVVAEVSALMARSLPVTDLVAQAKQILSRALASDTFRLDCLDAALADQRAQRGVIHSDPKSRYSLCLFYWAPRYYSPPHEHRNWTATGVVHGSLEVRLHERARNGELTVRKSLVSAPGEVGALVPPCIHTVGNPGDSPAVSLHLFGPTEHQPDAIWLGEVTESAPPAWRPLKFWATVEAAAALPSPRAADILARVFAGGSVDMRRLVLDRLASFDSERANALDEAWQKGLADRADDPEVRPGRPPDSVWSRGARIETNRRAGADPKSIYAQRLVKRALAFPMDEIIERYRLDHDVGAEDAALHEREINRFLALAALYPDHPLGMAGKADDLWHTFLIFTREYHRFCATVAGHYIHHRPTPKTEPKELGRANYVFFHEVYERVFGEAPAASVWPSIANPCSKPPSGGDPLCGCTPCGPNCTPVPCNNRPPCESLPPTDEPVCECPTDDPVCECPTD